MELTVEEFYLMYHYFVEYSQYIKPYYINHFAPMLRESKQFNEQKQISDEELCCICIRNQINVILNCSHGFCEECIGDWQKQQNSCPVCRAQSQMNCSPEAWVIAEKYLNQEGVQDTREKTDEDYERTVMSYPFRFVKNKKRFSAREELNRAPQILAQLINK
jgi:hypothetical protein